MEKSELLKHALKAAEREARLFLEDAQEGTLSAIADGKLRTSTYIQARRIESISMEIGRVLQGSKLMPFELANVMKTINEAAKMMGA